MSPQKIGKKKPAARTSDEETAETDKVTAELQQIADENAALKKLLELVGTALPNKPAKR